MPEEQLNLVTGRPSELFPGQLENEEVLIFIRRHWMAFATWAILLVLMVGIPLIVALIFIRPGLLDTGNSTAAIAVVLLGSVYLLVANAMFVTAWIEYYLDVGVLTSERLVVVEQVGLFSRKVIELPLIRVQDVSAHMHGYLQTLLRYGTVTVESASDMPNFILKNVPQPYTVANTILLLHDKQMARERASNSSSDNRLTRRVINESSRGSDYQYDHLHNDLLTQARKKNEKGVSILPQALNTSQDSPNRLPMRSSDRVSGELKDGQIIDLSEEKEE